MRHVRDGIVSMMALAACLSAIPPKAQGQMVEAFNKSVSAATTIVVGRLDQYIAEPEMMDRMVEDQLRESSFIGGNPSAIVLGTVQPRGTYVFTVTSTIMGHPPQPLVMRLPRLTEPGSVFAEHKLHIPLKGTYLLLLSGDEMKGFSPTSLAPVLISDKARMPREPLTDAKPEVVLSAVVQILTDSLGEPAARSMAAQLLAGARSEEALKAMRLLADDPDVNVRSRALESMAENQDVTAIPRIGLDEGALGALEKYKTAAAIPYLNPLVTDAKSKWTRLNATMALRQMPTDKTSIPFLIKALRDPENTDTGVQAYYTLYALIPELGRPKRVGLGGQISEEDIARAEAWWADEQAGKHKSLTP